LICRAVGQSQVANADLHAAQRRLGIHRVARDRLLSGHARIELARRRVGADLDDYHRRDQQNAESRGDAELGSDRQIEK